MMIMMEPFDSFISFYVISLFLLFLFEFLLGVLIMWKCIGSIGGYMDCVVCVVLQIYG